MATTNTVEKVRQHYDSARLSVAAYAVRLSPSMSQEQYINALAGSRKDNVEGVGFTSTQAQSFASRYEVIAPTFSAPSGAQVNIFRDRVTGETHFAIAGTQPKDFVQDILLADFSIVRGDPPLLQLVDVVNYYYRVTTPSDQLAPQVSLRYELTPTFGIGSGFPGIGLTPRFSPSTAPGLEIAPKITSCAGHSLGGGLCNGTGRLTDVDTVVTVNAPGQLSFNQASIYQDMSIALGRSLRPWPDAAHLDGSGISVISGLWGHDGGETVIIPLPQNTHSSAAAMTAVERMYEIAQRYPDRSLTEVADMTRRSYEGGLPWEIAERIKPVGEVTLASNQPRPTRDLDATESPDSYVVQKGDNLWNIAERYGIPYETLRTANSQITHPELIHEGQRLTIPGLGLSRELAGELDSAGAELFSSDLPQATTPPASPAPRLDENGMPLPEIKEGAAYDPHTDPVYQTLMKAFRESQAADHSIPPDAVQVADSGAISNDAGPGYGPADPNAPPANGLTPSPEAPTTFGISFGEGTNTDPLTQPAYSFNKLTTDEALSQQHWTTANSYAQGTQSALSFIQALEQGNELSAVLSGMSMLNAFAKASGITDPSHLPFSPTTTSSLGAVSAAFNLRDALKTHDELGALAAGTNLGSQATFVYASYAESAAAEVLAKNLGTAAGVLGIANSLKNGDEAGAAISALIAFGGPASALVGTVLAIGRALRGPKAPPEVHGEAEVVWTENGSLDIRVSADQNGGGERARSTLASLLAPIEEQLRTQTDVHGDPGAALIPQRLPAVIVHAQYESHLILRTRDDEGRPVERYYDGAGNRIGLDGSIESTFAEDFLNEIAQNNAIVPTWEADTIRQRMGHGDSEAWKEEAADATSLSRGPRLDPIGETLPAPEEVKGGLMALTFHLPGLPSPEPSPEGRGEEGEDPALTPALSRGERGNEPSARFDLDGDSYLDPVDWNGPYQAFLALDRDGNGVIDSGRELITTQASASHRTASLEWLDANNDGVLNSNDPAFGVLKLWLDVNSNAHAGEGELASLAELGIAAIDFTQSPPVIVDGEGNTQPLTPKHLIPKGEGARIASDAGGTEIELQDGYRALYLRAGDGRIQSAAPNPSVQEELARHTATMSREAQGLFGGHAALLTGLAVAQTAAAGNAPAQPLTLNEVEHAINAAQTARTLASDGNRHYGENTAPTPALPREVGGSVTTSAGPSPSFPLPEGEGDEPRLAWLAPVNSGTPDYVDGSAASSSGDTPVFTNPLTTGEIIAGAEDTALILTPAALLANDFSRNSNATLRISAVGNATRGTVALLDTGEVVFTPELNYFGPASFIYTVSDQWGYFTETQATVNLVPVNDAPVIENVEVGRPVFGYQSVTVRQYSVDWQPGWAYDSNTGQYYQDMPTLQAVNHDTTALGLIATNSLLNGSGSPLTPTYYQSGQLRPIAFDAIDATQGLDDGNGNITYTRLDDPTRMQGRVISYDIDGDSTAITYSLGGNPAHGHASVGWMASADAPEWPTLQPDQLGNYAQYLTGAWQYASHPGDQYTGTDPFQVAATDGEGGITMATVSAWHHGTNQGGGGGKKPVALDLDGNGLDFVGLDDSNVYFDVNGDGWREHIAWTGQNDGLLVLDTEGDRVIDKPEEISFAQYLMGAITDLEGLNAFDTNDDGLLSRLDARFGDFAVWQDVNLNGLSEEGEVLTLAERGIESVNLTSDQIPQSLANGDIQLFGTSTYTTTDGETRLVGDAAFQYTNQTLPPPASVDTASPDQAEVMRMALVFTEMSAAFGAGIAPEPLASLDTTVTDPAIVTYDDPMGLTPGGKT